MEEVKTPKQMAEEYAKDNIKPSEPHRITHKIRQMVDEVTQSHIDEPSRSYVDIANLEAILKYVAEDEV